MLLRLIVRTKPSGHPLDESQADQWLEAQLEDLARGGRARGSVLESVDIEAWTTLETLVALEPSDADPASVARRYETLLEHFSDVICLHLARERAQACRALITGTGRPR
jgi:hypothetical protein